MLLRRASVGLIGCGLSVAALAYLGWGGWLGIQSPLPALGWATVGAGAVSLLVGGAGLVRSVRLLPAGGGDAGDLAFDFGLAADPWRLARWIALVVALCIAVAGAVQSHPIDGALRAVADGLLCLAGFGLLGRPLGLRR